MGTGSSGQVLSMQGHVGTAGNRIHAPGTVLNDKFGSADLGATILPRFRAEIRSFERAGSSTLQPFDLSARYRRERQRPSSAMQSDFSTRISLSDSLSSSSSNSLSTHAISSESWSPSADLNSSSCLSFQGPCIGPHEGRQGIAGRIIPGNRIHLFLR